MPVEEEVLISDTPCTNCPSTSYVHIKCVNRCGGRRRRGRHTPFTNTHICIHVTHTQPYAP